jgi:hypothetical protein
MSAETMTTFFLCNAFAVTYSSNAFHVVTICMQGFVQMEKGIVSMCFLPIRSADEMPYILCPAMQHNVANSVISTVQAGLCDNAPSLLKTAVQQSTKDSR